MKPARFGCLLLGWVLLTGSPLAAGTEPAPAPEAADLDTQVGPLILRDESIDQVLALLERWTGKTMLRPQALPATAISLSLRGSVPRDEAIRALETLLILNGIALTPLGEQFIKVTALTAAKSEAPELIEGTTLTRPASGRMASKIFQLTFLRVADFMPQITGLLNPAAASPPVIFEKTNAALITDSISNLQRIETLLRQMDQPVMEGLNPAFYPLRYAKANDVVNRMRAILGGPLQTQIGSAVSYNADERSNQVIVVSDPRQHPFFEKLIQRLDVKSSQDMKHEVIYLMHAAAKDMAAILSQLVAGQNSAAKSGGLPGPRPAPIDPATAAGPAAPAPAPAVVAALAGNAGFEASNQFSSSITILPEERSNSLIVSGTADDIRLISDIIAKFDILLAQVRIEVVIAEVSLGDNATSGISALGLTVAGDKLTGFRGAGAGMNITDGLITRPGVAGTGPLDLAALISLATTPRKSIATILSVPTIITSHSKEGRIFVGEQRPVISSYLNDGATAGGGTLGVGYRSTVSSKDIGIQLSVKPLIGADGAVELEIKQEVNDILGDITIDGNPQPRIGRRTTESFVSVRSGEIIVLGGLQRGSESRSTSRLGPLPLVGDLLGSRSREKTRTDLVFFLRPTVLTNTPKDNLEALNQIRQFPEEPREELARILSDR